MPSILALDTSTDACSVALLHQGQIREDFRLAPRQHTHLLLPMVYELLAEAQVSLQQLDGIAFGRGPGSFAGIRIATGAAQGLGLAADLPLLPISTLRALAHAAAPRYAQALLVAALDARMDEIYCAAWQPQGAQLTQEMAEAVLPPAALCLPQHQQIVGIGSGWRYLESMSAVVRTQVQQVEADVHPRASAMAELAREELNAGRGLAPELAQPVYLRDQVAVKKKDR